MDLTTFTDSALPDLSAQTALEWDRRCASAVTDRSGRRMTEDIRRL